MADEAPKRGRGRPRKVVEEAAPKRPRGRPRKVVEEEAAPKRPRGRPRKVVAEAEALKEKRPVGRPRKEGAVVVAKKPRGRPLRGAIGIVLDGAGNPRYTKDREDRENPTFRPLARGERRVSVASLESVDSFLSSSSDERPMARNGRGSKQGGGSAKGGGQKAGGSNEKDC